MPFEKKFFQLFYEQFRFMIGNPCLEVQNNIEVHAWTASEVELRNVGVLCRSINIIAAINLSVPIIALQKFQSRELSSVASTYRKK